MWLAGPHARFGLVGYFMVKNGYPVAAVLAFCTIAAVLWPLAVWFKKKVPDNAQRAKA